jgi:hypothetical protein
MVPVKRMREEDKVSHWFGFRMSIFCQSNIRLCRSSVSTKEGRKRFRAVFEGFKDSRNWAEEETSWLKEKKPKIMKRELHERRMGCISQSTSSSSFKEKGKMIDRMNPVSKQENLVWFGDQRIHYCCHRSSPFSLFCRNNDGSWWWRACRVFRQETSYLDICCVCDVRWLKKFIREVIHAVDDHWQIEPWFCYCYCWSNPCAWHQEIREEKQVETSVSHDLAHI